MEVYIEVIAMDRETGLKKTIKETVTVPKAVLQVHGMFVEEGNPGALVTAIAQSVYGGARKELDAGRKNQRTAMNAMVERSGGRIGGHQPSPQQAAPAAPGHASPPPKMDPLAESLGLDIIQRSAQREGHVRTHVPAPAAPPPTQMGPGPAGGGFPPGHPGYRG